MKKIFIIIFCCASFTSFSQQEELTKIKFKIIADCNCTIQFARNDKAAGQVFKMVSDSFMIAIEKETTGFYITCGTSDTVYLKIPYQPGQAYYKILGKMPCDKKGGNEITIEPIKI